MRLRQTCFIHPALGLDVILAICTRRVGSDDRRQFEQGLATNGLSFHSQQSTLVIVEEQSLATELLQQSIDLSILELDDLLLTLVEDAADGLTSRMCQGRSRQDMVTVGNQPVSGDDSGNQGAVMGKSGAP